MNAKRVDRNVSEEQEQAAWEQWECIGSELRELVIQMDSDTFYRVEPGSALAADDERSHPFEISHIVGVSLVTSIDHLNAMEKLVRQASEMPICAPQALARSSIESAAVGLWVLSPRKRLDRVERAFRWWFQNSENHKHARDDYGERGHPRFRARLRELAGEQGLTEGSVSRGYSISRVLDDVRQRHENLDELKFAWQLGSGFAHGRPWAMLGSLSSELVDEDDVVARFRMTNSFGLTVYLAGQSLLAISTLIALRNERATNHVAAL